MKLLLALNAAFTFDIPPAKMMGGIMPSLGKRLAELNSSEVRAHIWQKNHLNIATGNSKKHLQSRIRKEKKQIELLIDPDHIDSLMKYMDAKVVRTSYLYDIYVILEEDGNYHFIHQPKFSRVSFYNDPFMVQFQEDYDAKYTLETMHYGSYSKLLEHLTISPENYLKFLLVWSDHIKEF